MSSSRTYHDFNWSGDYYDSSRLFYFKVGDDYYTELKQELKKSPIVDYILSGKIYQDNTGENVYYGIVVMDRSGYTYRKLPKILKEGTHFRPVRRRGEKTTTQELFKIYYDFLWKECGTISVQGNIPRTWTQPIQEWIEETPRELRF